MAHPEQQEFFRNIRARFPDEFKGVKVIDCGSLDVNGSLRSLFDSVEYIGVDIAAGRGVDIVSKIHELSFKEVFDVVVSGEMLEHDEYWRDSLRKMYDMCKSGGLIIISAAGEGRPEHGTTRTGAHWGTSHDYYKNILESDIEEVFKKEEFSLYEISHERQHCDIFFVGRKI